MSIKNCYGRSPIGDSILKPLVTAFERLFSHIHPLGPTRVDPQRHYHWEGTHPESVGQNGLNAIDALLSARVDQQTTPYEDKNVRIEDRISAWLQDMDLAYSFSLKRANSGTDRNYDVLIQKGPASAQVALADMGYGLSQFLPVLVHCYYVPEGSTLILEQPGIHLHPMVQSQLADLLIEVVNERKLQILVESHSEHLLTRLQRRIAEKQIDQNNVALYFCRNNEGVSTIEKLDVDESGDIKNWPENFFGDVMGDMFAMTDKQVESIAEKGTEG
jgi:predicted ATPase